MNERLLQYIWQFRYFNHTELTTVAGEAIRLFSSGEYNTNQGPDFLQARLRIGTTEWAGSVELHIRTSDWLRHRHAGDLHYNNVVLHVVWQHDTIVNDIPVLELQPLVPAILLQRYSSLMESSTFIPCAQSIHTIRDIVWKAWKERLLAERLLRKTVLIKTYLGESDNHWEELFWWLLARSFGSKVNADAFELIARSVPVKLLSKNKHQLHQLEALLFGQAGLLSGSFEEQYPQMLQKEYWFQQKKYSIKPVAMPLLFMRMRPVNFPSIRLAQLAMLVRDASHLFSKIREARDVQEVKKWFDVTANDYWHYHYRFDTLVSYREKRVGLSMVNSIIVNTVCPVLFAYGDYHQEEIYKQKALQWLEETAAETNFITRGFRQLGLPDKTAYDSQSLIELKNEYCNHKRCLDCAIGNALLKKER